jgi:serine/threonine-protein kinase
VAAAPARRVIGRYALESELGRGGMGVVYAARDGALDRALALKVLIAGAYASEEARHRFIAEARAVAALKHPSLVPVFDMGESDGLPWYVMERVHGPTLDDVIRIGGPLPEAEAIRVTALVSRAVHHAHETGLAHRDIKPGNVLMEGDGRPRVTDFGLVRPLDGPMGVTATQQVLGTPAYLAGEVARGESDIDWLRVDVFGLGALLYTALSGRPPALGRSSAQVLSGPPRRVAARAADRGGRHRLVAHPRLAGPARAGGGGPRGLDGHPGDARGRCAGRPGGRARREPRLAGHRGRRGGLALGR